MQYIYMYCDEWDSFKGLTFMELFFVLDELDLNGILFADNKLENNEIEIILLKCDSCLGIILMIEYHCKIFVILNNLILFCIE